MSLSGVKAMFELPKFSAVPGASACAFSEAWRELEKFAIQL
jgi:hypothetical protein